MLPALQNLMPFALFAFVASITPGPTNILVLSNSARYGFIAAMPIVLGACLAATGIVLAVGSGLGHTLINTPGVQPTMQWAGILWLSYLAWQIFTAPVAANGLEGLQDKRRLGLLGAAALQWVNPKTWMMALAVVGVFTHEGGERQQQVLQCALLFLLISVLCLSGWAWLGAGSGRWLRSAPALRRFNRGMALLLLASAWLTLWV